MYAVICVMASLREDIDAVAQRPPGRSVRADLDYVEGVVGAGGVPVVFPPVGGAREAEALLEGIDGLLLSGGTDLDPSYYGEEAVPELGGTAPERDAFEMSLLEHALPRCAGQHTIRVDGTCIVIHTC